MKQIPLTCGKFALVDDEDFEFLSQWNWTYKPPRKEHHTGYAVRTTSLKYDEKKTALSMHRVLKGEPSGKDVDHEDGNGLNNQKYNLRIASRTKNMMNQKKTRGTSKYKGVSWNTQRQKWASQIKYNGKQRHIGRYTSEVEAALAYNEKAKIHFGEFAKLNEIPNA